MLSSILEGVVGEVTIEVIGMPPDTGEARGWGAWPLVAIGDGVISAVEDW
jgi:hypothetical protein